jgi:hypothetical protein
VGGALEHFGEVDPGLLEAAGHTTRCPPLPYLDSSALRRLEIDERATRTRREKRSRRSRVGSRALELHHLTAGQIERSRSCEQVPIEAQHAWIGANACPLRKRNETGPVRAVHGPKVAKTSDTMRGGC